MIAGGAARRLIHCFAFALLLAPIHLTARAQDSAAVTPEDGPSIPEAVGYVNDHAGVIDETTRAKLEAFLDRLEKTTGCEFAILAVRSTEPLTPSEYKVLVFERWGIGKRGEDNGLLMLVAIEEREVRFETGYGLEGVLPDGLQSRIFRDVMRPRFRQGDYAGGITAGVLACAARIAKDKGVTLEWDGKELRYDESEGPPALARAVVVGVFLVVLLILVPIIVGANRGGRRRRRFPGWWIGPGMGGGWGGGFGGGGFGGGGGGFGGGGGGSFGGFGGGSSGGGGGGGSW